LLWLPSGLLIDIWNVLPEFAAKFLDVIRNAGDDDEVARFSD
jgi:hypothetical protein